jgi:hypothetical protein
LHDEATGLGMTQRHNFRHPCESEDLVEPAVTNSVDMTQLHNFRHPCEREDLVPLFAGTARYPIGVGYDELARSGMARQRGLV